MSYKEDPTAHFMMRMTPAEKADLLAKAKRCGLTQAGFVRKAIKGTEVLGRVPKVNEWQERRKRQRNEPEREKTLPSSRNVSQIAGIASSD